MSITKVKCKLLPLSLTYYLRTTTDKISPSNVYLLHGKLEKKNPPINFIVEIKTRLSNHLHDSWNNRRFKAFILRVNKDMCVVIYIKFKITRTLNKEKQCRQSTMTYQILFIILLYIRENIKSDFLRIKEVSLPWVLLQEMKENLHF